MYDTVRRPAGTNLMDAIGWGIILWALGFVLGMVFFVFVPVEIIGLYVLPIIVPLTYLIVGISWAVVAVVLDYLLLVRLFNAQNYYDLDIIIYYGLTFLIPVAIGLKFSKPKTEQMR
jgi:hypothetical protein